MTLDTLRKSLEALPEPPPESGINHSLEGALKPPSALAKMRSSFAYLKDHYQAALDNARECNIMDALHEMAQAHDSGDSLATDARNAYRNRLITLNDYSETLSAVENFQLFGLPEDVAKTILGNCECKKG